MASMLLGTSPLASSGTAVEPCEVRNTKNGSNEGKGAWKRKALLGSYVTKASLYESEKIKNEYPIMRHQQHNLKHHYKKYERSYVVHVARGESSKFEPQDPTHSQKTFWSSIMDSLDAFYRFSRAYMLIGSVVSIISLSFLAVENVSDISPKFFIGLLQALVATLAINVYVAGLNQLTDIEIDKINKPYLPLASGEYSFRTGVIIVASCLILSFGLGWIVGSPPLFGAICTFFMLGTAYSIDLPMLGWKRSAVLAAMYFVAVRGIMFQFAFFLHMQTYVFKRPTMIPSSLIFATAFMSLFSVVLALIKDLPDIEGDKKFGIQSLSVRLGQKRVLWICVSLVELAYGVAILIGASSSYLSCKLITGFGHALLALVLWHHSKSVDLTSKESMQSFYMFILKLFYAEYFIIPFIR